MTIDNLIEPAQQVNTHNIAQAEKHSKLDTIMDNIQPTNSKSNTRYTSTC